MCRSWKTPFTHHLHRCMQMYASTSLDFGLLHGQKGMKVFRIQQEKISCLGNIVVHSNILKTSIMPLLKRSSIGEIHCVLSLNLSFPSWFYEHWSHKTVAWRSFWSTEVLQCSTVTTGFPKTLPKCTTWLLQSCLCLCCYQQRRRPKTGCVCVRLSQETRRARDTFSLWHWTNSLGRTPLAKVFCRQENETKWLFPQITMVVLHRSLWLNCKNPEAK